MKFLIAPDSFKGTYSAAEVAAHIAAGVRKNGGAASELPVADGGEGTYEILCDTLGAELIEVETVGPWDDPLRASYALAADGTALIGLAAASGITLPCSGERSAITADTYGTGLLMADAALRGATEIVVAAGGSATTDGGTGAVAAIEGNGGLRGAKVVVLSDVATVFEDAATVFGPQKGASPEQVAVLTERLHKQAAAYPRDPRGIPRTGAAGGFSGGMWAQYGAELVSGAEFILDAVGFDSYAAEADAIVVGEGRLDSQTGQGKIISAILARNPGKPVYAVVGSIHADLGGYADNFAGIIVATDTDAMQRAGQQLAMMQPQPST
ncbi:glycerate kinase [Arthrobacter crystallopoietes BAB-32]|uniref:Glycerate kinase n=1 Tax=Arthrobacter crystallopoietes BAB-32 TaxID=1246476 RepID=N1UZG4_9MICC|nr:glycerate kinase [Arthrobacter crystallopoietes]EMY34455.1 glycerate kinase [Arthrobacter crystallopoietes BAB-32]